MLKILRVPQQQLVDCDRLGLMLSSSICVDCNAKTNINIMCFGNRAGNKANCEYKQLQSFVNTVMESWAGDWSDDCHVIQSADASANQPDWKWILWQRRIWRSDRMPFSELYFNVDNGYLEGLVRGFKAGILSQADYLNLVQCETLEGELKWIASG